MKYSDYMALSNTEKAKMKVKNVLLTMPKKIKSLLGKIGSGIKKCACGVKDGFVGFGSRFIKGDIFTKFSYLIMGAGCFTKNQIVKGILFLAAQVGYIYYMVTFGLNQIVLLRTLGTATQLQVWDETIQMYRYVKGHNSMLILLFGVCSIALTLVFFALYVINTKVAYKNQQLIENGEKPSGIKEDVRQLLDSKVHITYLSVPAVGLIAFTVLPLIFMVLMAFTNYDKFHQPPGNLFTWVGLANFKDMLWNDPLKSKTFVEIFKWTVVWSFFATITNYILGMVLAIMINKKGIKFKKFWRTIFVTTIAVPQFVSLMLMSKLLHDLGPINVILQNLGLINSPIPFFTDGNLARIFVIIVNMWVGIPYTMLITSGILMNIPQDLYESARIDGASAVKTFTKITLPYMLFVTTPYLITQFIGNMNNFNVIFLLTGGDPKTLDYFQAGKTDLLVTWLYKQTVTEQNYNIAATIAIMMFVVVAVVSLITYNASSSIQKEDQFQ